MDGRHTVVLNSELLRAQDVRRTHGTRTVLDVSHLAVHANEVLALLGPNGAGKSTLFRILLLLESPDGGAVYVGGRAAHRGERSAALRMAGVFQRPHLFSGSVLKNVSFGLRARGLAAAECARRSDATLRMLGIAALAHADVRTLSGGESQRVAVARALAVEPDVLLLDEPTAGLDVTVRRRFREDLERAVRRQARAVVLITHDPADAFALADRIAVLEHGRIVQTGTPDDLVLAPATPFIATFTGAELLLDGTVDALDADLVRMRTVSGAHVWGMASEALDAGAAVHASYRPEDITLVAPATDSPTSAINRFRVRVVSVVTTGTLVRVRLQADTALTATITRRSAEALHLEAGASLEAHLKASAVRVFRARPEVP